MCREINMNNRWLKEIQSHRERVDSLHSRWLKETQPDREVNANDRWYEDNYHIYFGDRGY